MQKRGYFTSREYLLKKKKIEQKIREVAGMAKQYKNEGMK